MKWIYLVIFAVYSILLVITRDVTARDLYIGATIFLAAEYIEDAIERNKGG